LLLNAKRFVGIFLHGVLSRRKKEGSLERVVREDAGEGERGSKDWKTIMEFQSLDICRKTGGV